MGRLPATQRPYVIGGRTYYPLPSAHGFAEVGYASWYGDDFHGKSTACGETYNMYAMTAAHKTLPMNTYVQVTNLENGKEAVVRINDRGPFVKDRVLDLSYSAAKCLGMVGPGTARVRIQAMGEALPGPGAQPIFATYPQVKSGRFYVQVGAFADPARASALRRKLASRYREVVVDSQFRDGRTLYKVLVFAASQYDAAKGTEAALEGSGFPGAFVVAR